MSKFAESIEAKTAKKNFPDFPRWRIWRRIRHFAPRPAKMIRNRRPPMRRYILAGWAVWLTMVALYYSYEAFGRALMPKAIRRAVDVAMTIEGVATWPVALGGWLFVWGDGEQPPRWVTGMPFNVAVGLVLYGVLGLVIGALYSAWRKSHGRTTEIAR